MTKKKTTMLKLITSAVLVMAMCLGTMLTTLAAWGPKNEYPVSVGNGDTPAGASITKRLKVAEDTKLPDTAIFTFTFTKTGIDDDTTTAATGVMPNMGPLTINLSKNQAGIETIVGSGTDAGYTFYVKETGDFLSTITDGVGWPKEGIYKYRVKETGSGIVLNSADAVNEGAYYSIAEYDFEIWVAADSTGKMIPKYVVARTVKDAVDEYYPGDPGGTKVDPTPGGVKHEDGITIGDDFSQVMFTNRYWRSDGGGEENPKVDALVVSKTVTGNGADHTMYFPFTVTVTQPAIILPTTPAKVYMAYVLDSNDNFVTAAANYGGTLLTDAGGRLYIPFTSNAALTVNLKDGQKLGFADLHVGAKVEVMEARQAKYRASYVRTFGPNPGTFTAPNADVAWGFPRNPGDVGPHYIVSGSGTTANKADFTNHCTGEIPTGISVDNLPYVVFIGIMVLALLGFVVIKSRKNGKYDI